MQRVYVNCDKIAFFFASNNVNNHLNLMSLLDGAGRLFKV